MHKHTKTESIIQETWCVLRERAWQRDEVCASLFLSNEGNPRQENQETERKKELKEFFSSFFRS